MDVFVEQMVKRRFGTKDKLLTAGIVLAALLLSFIFILVVPVFIRAFSLVSFFFVAAAWYGAYWLISSLSLEFEYAVTNGDITVDKIIAKRRRKRILVADAKNIEEMGRYKESDHVQRNYDKRVIANTGEEQAEDWYFTFHHRHFGHTLLVFTPDEKTLEAIKPYLKRQVAVHAFSRY